MKDLRLGVDVGGTNTDAVVVDAAGRIVAETKTATTPEPIDGIVAAMTAVIDQLDDTTQLGKAMLGRRTPRTPSSGAAISTESVCSDLQRPPRWAYDPAPIGPKTCATS